MALLGPIFVREAVTAPRRPRLFLIRLAYILALLVIMYTAWMLLAGTQIVRNIGDMARFGMILFQILALLQLALVTFLASLIVASAIALEKDRRTLILLLMTRMANHELVLGKLFSGLLGVLVMLLAALPVFLAITLFGGVSQAQVVRVFLVTLMTALAASSVGALLAFSREKTFQTLALTALVLLVWLGVWEAVHAGVLFQSLAGWHHTEWATAFSPLRATLAAVRPALEQGSPRDLVLGVAPFLLCSLGLTVALNAWTIARVRVWNPSRELRPRQPEEAEAGSIWGVEHDLAQSETAGGAALDEAERRRSAHVDARVRKVSGRSRRVWDNPILWREVRTWAYGRKVIIIRLVYFALFLMSAAALHQVVEATAGIPQNEQLGTTIPEAARPLAPFFLISLVIINALAVTSITTERDGQAIDLLLVTDLTPKEFVFGKLFGIFWVTKEMIVLPIGLTVYYWWREGLNNEQLVFVLVGLLTMIVFVSMLGIHCGMSYANSRTAIGVSLGTVFFLFLGVITCMALMLSFSVSFQSQLVPFSVFILGGSVGLYLALGFRNPSPAIAAAALFLPWGTFHAITSFLLGHVLAVFILTCGVYGFTTAVMMVPAISDFNIALGRSKAGGGD